MACLISWTSCTRPTAASWTALATLPEEQVTLATGPSEGLDWGHVGDLPARFRQTRTESFFEVDIARSDWRPVAPAGTWVTTLPDVAPPGLDPTTSAPTTTETLTSAGHSWRPAALDPAGFAASRNTYLRIDAALQLRLPDGVEPPERATYAWRCTYASVRDGRHRVSGRTISGDGFALPPGTHCDVRVSLPTDAELCFATAGETLLPTGDHADVVRHHGGAQPAAAGASSAAPAHQRFRVFLEGALVFEHEQVARDSGAVTWHRVALPASSKPAQLRFEVEGDPAFTSFLAPTLAPRERGGYAARPWGKPRPDVVVFLADTLRADTLSAYDTGFRPSGVDLTPRLDRFVASSRAFTRARSVGTWTLPAVSTIVTGLFPHQSGADDPGAALPQGVRTLAERFGDRGYRTAAITEGGFVSKQHGFARGFHAFLEGPPSLDFTLDAAEAVLEADDGRPLFLVVHTFRAHGPYEVSAETRERLGQALGLTAADTWEAHWSPDAHQDPERVDALKRLYLGGVADLDAGFGRFHDTLQRYGLLDSGIVAFTSDHGESFDEHGALLHTGAPHEELVRVPLVLHAPGATPGLDDAPASLVDLAPTLLGMAGLEVDPELQGLSLLELSRERTIYAFECAQPGEQSDVALVRGERKLMARSEEGRLASEIFAAYDLDADPGETRNLESEAVPWTRELFERHAEALGEVLVPRVATSEAAFDPRHREELEALGYLGDDGSP